MALATLQGIALGESLSLPEPCIDGTVSLEAALVRRRSRRAMDPQALSLEHVGQLLWAAQGVTDPAGLRAAPSAGACYPLRLRVACAAGVFLYLPEGHRLRKTSGQDLRRPLAAAAYSQEYVRDCGALLVFSALYERTMSRYGDRGRRYVAMDVGHAAQNVHLQAVALCLVSVPVGAFDDDSVARVCELPPEELPVYLVPVGAPRA